MKKIEARIPWQKVEQTAIGQTFCGKDAEIKIQREKQNSSSKVWARTP